MRIHKILLNTKAEGPGVRACIWVQGCSHHCPGCFAEHTWDYNEGLEYSSQELIEKLDTVIDDIEGITLLGGEPFDQAEELSVIAAYAKNKGKNVISFTGYTYEELKGNAKMETLLEYTDLLCDGAFAADKIDFSRPLIGSSNQRMIYLTKAISPEVMDNYKNSLEVRISKNGLVEVNGMGEIKELEEYLRRERGIKDGIRKL